MRGGNRGGALDSFINVLLIFAAGRAGVVVGCTSRVAAAGGGGAALVIAVEMMVGPSSLGRRAWCARCQPPGLGPAPGFAHDPPFHLANGQVSLTYETTGKKLRYLAVPTSVPNKRRRSSTAARQKKQADALAFDGPKALGKYRPYRGF